MTDLDGPDENVICPVFRFAAADLFSQTRSLRMSAMDIKSGICDLRSQKPIKQNFPQADLSERDFLDRLSSLELSEIFLILKRTSDNNRVEALETEIIRRHIGLVKSVVLKKYEYPVQGMGEKDKESLGFVGLLVAIRKYDPDRGVPFSSWAYRCIASHILDGIRSHGWVPRHRVTLYRKLRKIRESGTELPEKEEREFQLLKSRMAPIDSLDRPVPAETEVSLGETLKDPEFDLDEMIDAIMEKERLPTLLESLTKRERKVVHLIFTEGLVAAEAGRRLGISKQRVIQIREAALKKLRRQSRIPRLLTGS